MSHHSGQIELDFIVKCSGTVASDGQCYDAGADDIGLMVPDRNQPKVTTTSCGYTHKAHPKRWASILEGLPPEYANMVKLNINSLLEEDMATEIAYDWQKGAA